MVGLLKQRDVRRYLEIGARHGDTFHHIMTQLPAGSFGVAVDLPGALWGTPKSSKHLKLACQDLLKRGYDTSIVFANSQTESTQRLLAGFGPFDAVFIDGDHSLAGVTRDWELYKDFAPLVAFHDIAGTGQEFKATRTPVEVPILWKKLRRQNECREFIEPNSRMGIGVVCNSI